MLIFFFLRAWFLFVLAIKRARIPRMRWNDDIKIFVEEKGTNLSNVEESRMYEDWDRWKGFIQQDHWQTLN